MIRKPIQFYIQFKGFEKLDHRTGLIGLHLKTDFIQKLKKYSEIKNYDWSIRYSNIFEEKGEIVIGDLPHIYDKKNYKDKNLRTSNIAKQNELEWGLNFDEVYLIFRNIY